MIRMEAIIWIMLIGSLAVGAIVTVTESSKKTKVMKKEGLLSNIRDEYDSLTRLVEKYYNITACKKCYEKSMDLLQISPTGQSVLYQCQHCNSKARAKSNNDDACEESVQIWERLRTLMQKSLKYEDAFIDDANLHNDFVVNNNSHTNRLQKEASRYLPEKVRHEVWRRDEGKCCICGSNEKLEFDHIIPFSKGGSNTTRNIQLLCEVCNRQKSAKI